MWRTQNGNIEDYGIVFANNLVVPDGLVLDTSRTEYYNEKLGFYNKDTGRYFCVEVGTLENNCGVLFLQSFKTGGYYTESKVIFDRVWPCIEEVAVGALYGQIVCGVNDSQETVQKWLEEVGFSMFKEFKSPRTGCRCRLMIKDITS